MHEKIRQQIEPSKWEMRDLFANLHVSFSGVIHARTQIYTACVSCQALKLPDDSFLFK